MIKKLFLYYQEVMKCSWNAIYCKRLVFILNILMTNKQHILFHMFAFQYVNIFNKIYNLFLYYYDVLHLEIIELIFSANELDPPFQHRPYYNNTMNVVYLFYSIVCYFEAVLIHFLIKLEKVQCASSEDFFCFAVSKYAHVWDIFDLLMKHLVGIFLFDPPQAYLLNHIGLQQVGGTYFLFSDHYLVITLYML